MHGCRIIDFGSMMAEPLAAGLLAEQGADVIKVEPLHGDGLREAAGSIHKGTSAMFVNSNRGKRSIAINLKDERGIALARKLIKTADVVLENFREGAMSRLGLGYEDLRPEQPGLIYGRVNGYGKTGKMAHQRVFDPLIQAVSGGMTLNSDENPEILPFLLGDKVAATMLCQAITAALYERERSGLGQMVEVSMLHAVLWWMWPDNMTGKTYVSAPEVPAYSYATFNSLHRTRDDRYICILAPTNAEWSAVATAFDRPDWVVDERFSTVRGRAEHAAEYLGEIAQEVRKRDYDECLRLLELNDASFAPVNTRDEVINDPQIVLNQMLTEIEHPLFGTVRQPSSCSEFSRTPVESAPLAPAVNEHASEILQEIGTDDERIAGLVASGVVGPIPQALSKSQ